jgi:hypothetical protein
MAKVILGGMGRRYDRSCPWNEDIDLAGVGGSVVKLFCIHFGFPRCRAMCSCFLSKIQTNAGQRMSQNIEPPVV